MMQTTAQQIWHDENGVSIVEFAMVAPLLLMMLLGFFDVSYNMYANTMLQGAVHEAARDSSLEAANEAALDAAVTSSVREVAGEATLKFERKAYATFTAVAKAEEFTDINNDGQCNDNEPFEDANNNGVWDADQGEAGSGGARDAVLYNVTIRYPRAFPIAPFIGISEYHETTATTVLRNQPFDGEIDRSAIGNCI